MLRVIWLYAVFSWCDLSLFKRERQPHMSLLSVKSKPRTSDFLNGTSLLPAIWFHIVLWGPDPSPLKQGRQPHTSLLPNKPNPRSSDFLKGTSLSRAIYFTLFIEALIYRLWNMKDIHRRRFSIYVSSMLRVIWIYIVLWGPDPSLLKKEINRTRLCSLISPDPKSALPLHQQAS